MPEDPNFRPDISFYIRLVKAGLLFYEGFYILSEEIP
jgi:hypothetical protein